MANEKKFKYLGALLAGQVCRSDEAIRVHRLARDGYAGAQDFANAIRQDQSAILASQKNFAYVSAGQSDWLDLIRPLAWTLGGFQKRNSSGEDAIGPVTRWFRTNTFYRKPLIAGKIQATGEELCAWLPQIGPDANASGAGVPQAGSRGADGLGARGASGLGKGSTKGIAFLLGPYSFARLAEDTHYGSADNLALDYAQAIASNLSSLEKRGYAAVLLLEPAVGYDVSRGIFSKPGWYGNAIAKIKNENVALGVHFPLADAKDTLPLVEESVADFVGIDGVYTDFADVRTKKDVLVGIVDGERTTVETKEYIANRTSLFLESAQFSGNYYVGFNDRASDVPFAAAMEKIRVLAGFTPQ